LSDNIAFAGYARVARKKGMRISIAVKYVFLIFYAIITLFPVLWVLVTSFKRDFEVMARPFGFPEVWYFQNYVDAFVSLDVTRHLGNSLFYMILSTLGALTLSSMAAYVLSRVKPIKAVILYFTIGLMLPLQSIVLPFVVNLRMVHLSNTRISIILVYIVSNLSFNIFVLSGFMKSLPVSLEEAATIDGCGKTRTFLRIILPLSKPGLATVGTFTAINCWNEFFLALFILVDAKLKTLNLALFFLKATSERQARYALMAAGSVVLVVPIIIVYSMFQKQIIKGLVAGAVKG
jgi:raffinose/stachyose/melibiose transport system permease protein